MMDTLRWILLVLGLLIIGGLYGFYRWQEARTARGARRRGRRRTPRDRAMERDVDEALRDLDDLVIDDPDDSLEDLAVDPAEEDPLARREPPRWDGEQARADGILSPPRVRGGGPVSRGQETEDEEVSPPPERHPVAAQESSLPEGERDRPDPEPARVRERTAASAGQQPVQRDFLVDDEGDSPEEDDYQDAGEKIVVLHVTAGKGYCFTGPAIADMARQTGLVLGEQNIFYRYPDGDRRRTPLFGMASMVEPGTFEPDRMPELETPGLALFLQLPAPFDGVTAFEEMLETARRLADRLDGHLLDGRRCDLTQQAVEHIREDLREYRRRAHLAARRGYVH